jgi:hypothetical protein
MATAKSLTPAEIQKMLDYIESRPNAQRNRMMFVTSVLAPDGHPNSPTFGHLKFPHPERGVMTG